MLGKNLGRPLLIHSLGEFASITLPALEAAHALRICEIGAEHGGNTGILAEWLKPHGGTLISIDPAPSPGFIDWLSKGAYPIQHVPRSSLESIPNVGACDAWFIDGDHNWYTVFHELKLIAHAHTAAEKPLLVFVHDVGWPWARRDLYYAPERIPEIYRHVYTYELGVTLGHAEPVRGGFRGAGQFAFAMQEGGPRNGVLTAIEDFVAGNPDRFLWAFVPAIFGLGVLWERSHPASRQLASLLAPFHDHPLLPRLEANRLANFLRVIDLQDAMTRGPLQAAGVCA